MAEFILRDYQKAAVEAGINFFKNNKKKNHHEFQILPTGCHAKDTMILMADGSTKAVQNIVVGDKLIGPDSTIREVLQLCAGTEIMYKITPISGGESFVVNENHILHLISTNEGKTQYKSYQKGGEISNISVKDYINKSKSWKHLRKLLRPSVIEFSNTPHLPIPPYILGIILGDGTTLNGTVGVTTADDEIRNEFENYCQTIGCNVRVAKKKNNKAVCLYASKLIRIQAESKTPSNLMLKLRSLRIQGIGSGDKHIPVKYKTASIKDRLEILAGLIDTDGYLGVGGFDYISKSKRLAEDVCFISRSLGLKAKISECTKSIKGIDFTGTYFRVSLSGNTDIVPCRLPRKQAKPRLQIKNHLVTGFKVEEFGIDNFYGFQLSGDHLYITGDFMIHHNSGKSLVIANVIKELGEPTLILQPSKEILAQNYKKLLSYGFTAGIYSASTGYKFINEITYATIGSIVKKPHLFSHFKHLIIDECDLVNAKDNDTSYNKFIKSIEGVKLLGLTATPYRLTSGYGGAMLKFINRTNPRIFNKCNYYVQNSTLFNQGHLAKLKYYSFDVIKREMLSMNKSGTDFTKESLQAHYKAIKMPQITIHYANRLLEKRKNLLVFCSLVSEAEEVAKGIPGSVVVSAETPPDIRARYLSQFISGKIRCVINVGVLTVGFDFPGLECILVARSTMSLRLFYQMCGRGFRIAPGKEDCWLVDLGGNISFFGKFETMEIREMNGKLSIWNMGKQLTNVNFVKK